MITLIRITGIGLLLTAFIYVHAQDYFRGEPIPEGAPLNIAHRGASGHAPENTLAAVQLAMDMGADMIEIDLHFSRDGEAIVIHDATLDRTTNGSGQVKEFTTEELQKLDAGSWFDEKFEGERLPTLGEVLALIDGKVQILIELKQGKSGRYPGLEKRTIELVNQYGARDWAVLQSFEDETVIELRRQDPNLEVHKLIGGAMPDLPAYFDGQPVWGNILNFPGVQAINPHYLSLNPRFIHQAHARNLKVFTWTVNQPEDMQKLIDMGIDGIITNYPDRLKKLLEE